MTAGKTSLAFKVVSTGRLYPHGHGGKKEGGNYQFLMDRPSRGVFRAYTHVNALLDPTGEVMGSSPVAALREDPRLGVFDPDGSYLRTWIPEIADLDNTHIHAPWTLGLHAPAHYPAPIVDHAVEREEALARYKKVSGK